VKPSWQVTKLMLLMGWRRRGLVQVAAAGDAGGDLGHQARIAAHEAADDVAVAPFHSIQRKPGKLPTW
jgi:hypothetical protein